MFRPFVSKLLRRLAIAYGVSYVLWLVLYFDFLKASFEFFGPSAERGSLVAVLFGTTAAAIAVAGAVAAATLRVGDLRFVRGVVAFGVLANVGSLMAIGFDTPLAWGSLGLALIAFAVAWLAPAGQALWIATFVGVVGFGYPLLDHALWAARVAGPPAATAQATDAREEDGATAGRLPSVYIVLYDELALSLVNDRASFQSLPNLSRLAEAGVFYPRAYANADLTHLSIPSMFLGDLPDTDSVNHDFLSRRNLLGDLVELGYQLKVFNDFFSICHRYACAPLSVDAESVALVARPELVAFARDEFVARLTFGLRPNRGVGDLLQGQPARVFHFEHDRDHPQIAFLHLLDAHADYLRNRDGTLHHSAAVNFLRATEEDVARVADNYFEQLLYADALAGPLVDELLSIPPQERIVVLLSDHGISWREPPYGRGWGSLSSDTIAVPVVLIAPVLSPGVDSQLLPLIDLYPTLLDLINRAGGGGKAIEDPRRIAGLSIFALPDLRAGRTHHALSAGCRYVLDGDMWRFEGEVIPNAMPEQRCLDAPVAARQLANDDTTAQVARDTTAVRPLPASPGEHLTEVLDREPLVFLEYYDGWQVVRSRGRYYGVLLEGGLLDIARFQAGEYRSVVSADSHEGVQQEIKRAEETLAAEREPLANEALAAVGGMVVERAYNYSIVRYQDRYYVVPGDGGFVRSMVRQGSYASAETLAGAQAQVVPALTALADRQPDVAALIAEGYKSFNIVRYDHRYFGIRGGGAFEIERFRAGEYEAGVEDESFENIRRAIDEIVGE